MIGTRVVYYEGSTYFVSLSLSLAFSGDEHHEYLSWIASISRFLLLTIPHGNRGPVHRGESSSKHVDYTGRGAHERENAFSPPTSCTGIHSNQSTPRFVVLKHSTFPDSWVGRKYFFFFIIIFDDLVRTKKKSNRTA